MNESVASTDIAMMKEVREVETMHFDHADMTALEIRMGEE